MQALFYCLQAFRDRAETTHRHRSPKNARKTPKASETGKHTAHPTKRHTGQNRRLKRQATQPTTHRNAQRAAKQAHRATKRRRPCKLSTDSKTSHRGQKRSPHEKHRPRAEAANGVKFVSDKTKRPRNIPPSLKNTPGKHSERHTVDRLKPCKGGGNPRTGERIRTTHPRIHARGAAALLGASAPRKRQAKSFPPANLFRIFFSNLLRKSFSNLFRLNLFRHRHHQS